MAFAKGHAAASSRDSVFYGFSLPRMEEHLLPRLCTDTAPVPLSSPRVFSTLQGGRFCTLGTAVQDRPISCRMPSSTSGWTSGPLQTSSGANLLTRQGGGAPTGDPLPASASRFAFTHRDSTAGRTCLGGLVTAPGTGRESPPPPFVHRLASRPLRARPIYARSRSVE